MSINNKFNLIYDKWIPTTLGLSSLLDVVNPSFDGHLSVTPLYKISLLKFLLAIAQASVTPEDDDEWEDLRLDEFSAKIVSYLNARQDKFYLYGEHPFLQFKKIAEISEKLGEHSKFFLPLSAYVPFCAYGNNLCITDSHSQTNFSDEDAAIILITTQCLGLASKRVKNKIVLSDNSISKASTGIVSPFLKENGSLHCFFAGKNPIHTLYLNLLTSEDIDNLKIFSEGVGSPAWDLNIYSEDCGDAKKYLRSYMSYLVPLVRFCYIDAQNRTMCTTDGIYSCYPNLENIIDLSNIRKIVIAKKQERFIAQNVSSVLRPWRDLPSFFGLIEHHKCLQLVLCQKRVLLQDTFNIMAIGQAVSISKMKEQKVVGDNFFVDDLLEFNSQWVQSSHEFSSYRRQLDFICTLDNSLQSCVRKYFNELNSSSSTYDKKYIDTICKRASENFWSHTNFIYQEIISEITTDDGNFSPELKKKLQTFMISSYTKYCSAQGNRFTFSVKNHPRLQKWWFKLWK